MTNPIEKGITDSPLTGSSTSSIDAAKLGKGLNTIFKGYAMIFEAMAEQVELLSSVISQKAAVGKIIMEELDNVATPSTDKEAKDAKEDDSTHPWDNAAENTVASDKDVAKPSQSMKVREVTITVDDLLKVAAQKITTNRKNSPKIKALLTSYGCTAISEIPEEKREAFLNDLAQL